MSKTGAAALVWLILATFPVAAQDAATADAAVDTARERWSILVEEVDPCVIEREAADPDTIVVCEERGEAARYMSPVPRPVDGDRGAPRAPDVFGIPPCESYQICTKFGKVPPPAIMIDFDTLPETPEGSAAARWGGPTDADSSVVPVISEAGQPDVGQGLADEVIGP